MEKNEETPEPVEKSEGQTPAEEKVGEERPEGQAPVAEKSSEEKPQSETPVEQEVCNEKPGAVRESPGSKEINRDACMWAMICHLAGLADLDIPQLAYCRRHQVTFKCGPLRFKST